MNMVLFYELGTSKIEGKAVPEQKLERGSDGFCFWKGRAELKSIQTAS